MRKECVAAIIVTLLAARHAPAQTYNMTLHNFNWISPSTLVSSGSGSTYTFTYYAEHIPAYYQTCYFKIKVYLSRDDVFSRTTDFLLLTREKQLGANTFLMTETVTLPAPANGWVLPANGEYYVFMEIERGSGAPDDTNPADNIKMHGYRITVNSGILPEATISGYVRTAAGQGVSGVTLFGLPQNPTTNAQGFYTATVDHGFSALVMPSAQCYAFTPASKTYTNVLNNQTSQNYTATAKPPRISGHILLPSGKPVAGVMVQIGQDGPVVTTNFQGYYEAQVECEWSGVITPQKQHYAFTPASRTVDNVVNDLPQNFAAARLGAIYVDPTADGANDGSSWQNAFMFLQDALVEAGTGTNICVAGGVYRPDQGGSSITGDRQATFQLVAGAAMYGGFPNGGGDFSERDFQQHASVLTGDLQLNDGAGFTNRSDNALHVVKGADNATLDGFIVIGGQADGFGADSRGGGMYNSEVGTTIRNCTFTDNFAHQSGGAIHTVSADDDNELSLHVKNCAFLDNTAQKGGALYTELLADVLIEGCYFAFAAMSAGDVPYYGGAAYNHGCKQVQVQGCTFSGNKANDEGGALKNELVDAMVLRSCLFVDNVCLYGPGAGVHNRYSSCTAINCTFVRNAASFVGSGAGIFSNNSSLKITNSIFWQNTASGTATQAAQIYSSPQAADINYSCVQRLSAGAPGVGNIRTDPNFVDFDGGDLHLNMTSPCLNTGSPDEDYTGLYDIEGNRRLRYGRADVGAYEYVADPGDLQPDGRVNLADLGLLARYWLKECGAPGWCRDADIDLSGRVDAADLAVLVEQWTGADVQPNLVARWTMDDSLASLTVVDTSGNGLHGTASRNTADISVPGVLGKAFAFGGIIDYIRVQDAPLLSPSGELTICGWFVFNQPGQNAGLVWKHNYNFALYTVSQRVRFSVWNEAAQESRAWFSTSLLKPGWNYIAAVFDGAESRLYLNGAAAGAAGAPISGGIRDRDGDLYIGMRPDGVGDVYFEGVMDDIRVYDRALSFPEIQDMCAAAP